jgi:hypothetical protein
MEPWAKRIKVRMGSSPDSSYWRERAEEARTQSNRMRDAMAKETMLQIAHKYEAMAERAAHRELMRSS